MLSICQKYIRFLIILAALSGALVPAALWAQVPHDEGAGEAMAKPPTVEYYRAEVVEIIKEGEEKVESITAPQPYQLVKIRLQDGPDKDKEVEINFGGEYTITDNQKVKAGEKIVVVKTQNRQGDVYYITDKYRLNSLLWIAALFVLLVIGFGGWKGLTSILGLAVSLSVLIFFIIPRIIEGQNPLAIALLGALIIALVSLYLAHGFNKRTTVALASTLLTLGLATGLAMLFVSLAKLTGLGSEEAFFVQVGPLETLNLKGLLLGGIIIGALGVLDDITTAQAAVVDELAQANHGLSRRELYRRGLSVGREHIASLVNTLVLAYAGASFPLLLLFTVNKETGFWVIANGELLSEEIIRTLVGSSALVLAVPISTGLAAYFLNKRRHESRS